MTMLRKVIAIVTKSFYRRNRGHIKAVNKQLHRKSKSLSLYPSSATLFNRHQRTFSTSISSKQQPLFSKTSIKQEKQSVLKNQLIFIASVTTLSYLTYKYFNYDYNKDEETISLTDSLFLTAQNFIEHNMYKSVAFKLALFCDQRKQYDKALYFYKLYLRKPNTKKGEMAALNNMAIIYYKLNEWNNGLIVFELLGSKEICERNLEFLCAHSHHSLKQYQQALKYYHKFLQNPKSKQADMIAAYNNMALLYYEIGQYDEATKYFSKIGDETIKEKNYSFRVAHSLQNMDKFEESLKYYNLYLSNSDITKTNLQNTYQNLGVLFYENGKDKEAMDVFNRLGEDQIKKRNLEFKMAHLCARMGEKQAAIKYLKACKEKPNEYGEFAVICQGIMAQLMYETGDYTAAVAEFEALGEAEIVKQDLYYPAAFSFCKCGKYEAAKHFYFLFLQNKADKLSEEGKKYIHSRIALVCYKDKDYANALKIMSDNLSEEDLVKWNMEFIVAHCNHKLMKYEGARVYYLKFLENEKSDVGDVMNCYQNLALLYYDLNDYAKCIEYFRYLSAERIRDRNLEFYIGHSLHENGEYDECIKYYKAFLEKNPNKLDGYHNLGNVYYSKKEWKAAIEMYKHLSDAELVKRNLAKKLSECYTMMDDHVNSIKYQKLSMQSHQIEKIRLAQMYYNLYDTQRAIDIFKELGDEVIAANNLEFVCAHCYQSMADNKTAIRYYKMGLENERNSGDVEGIHRAYHNLGCAYHDDRDYKNAAECFEKLSKEHIIATNMEFIIAVSYHQLKKNEEALSYYRMFLDNPASKGSENVMSTYNNMVLIYYYSLSDYQKAWEILEKMGDEVIKEKNLEFEKAHCAQQLNDREAAMRYYAMLLRNSKDTRNERMVCDVYRNICALNGNDESFNHQIKQFKKSGDKQKELQLFVEWMTTKNVAK